MTNHEESLKIRRVLVAGTKAAKRGDLKTGVGQYGLAMFLLGRSRFDISEGSGFQIFHQIGDLERLLFERLRT